MAVKITSQQQKALQPKSGAEACVSCPKTTSPNANMSLSQKGLKFLYDHEADASSHSLHWPKGGSGVTLGAGYDMKNRSPSQISSDLQAIGVDKKTADALSHGSEKTGSEAEKFAKDNKALVSLSKDQQYALLKNDPVLAQVQASIRKNVSTPLTQDQYDALVSLGYNVPAAVTPSKGGQNPEIIQKINQGKTDEAAGLIWIYRRSGGEIMRGLENRRDDEAALFNSGQPVKYQPYGSNSRREPKDRL